MRLVGLVLAAALVAGCGGPERDPDRFREESAVTLSSAQGSLATTRLALRALLAGRMFTSSADDTITTAELALETLASSYGALQPPPGADDVRSRADDALADVQDAVTAARIATRRGDRVAQQAALDDVEAAGDALDEVLESLR